RWKIASLAKIVVPYRSDDSVERGIAMTRDVLRAGVDLARSRGAVALIAVPQLGDEDGAERRLRQRILDDAGLPYVFLAVDSAWRLPWDPHPNAAAAHAIAANIAARLPRAPSGSP